MKHLDKKIRINHDWPQNIDEYDLFNNENFIPNL